MSVLCVMCAVCECVDVHDIYMCMSLHESTVCPYRHVHIAIGGCFVF